MKAFRVRRGSVVLGVAGGGSVEHGPGSVLELGDSEVDVRRLLEMGTLEEVTADVAVDEAPTASGGGNTPSTPLDTDGGDDVADIVAAIDDLPDEHLGDDGRPDFAELRKVLGRAATDAEIERAIDIYVARADEDQ